MRGTTEKRWLRAEEGAYGDEPWSVPGPFLRREPPKCREFTIPVKNVTDRNSPPSKFKFKVDAKGLYSAQSFKQQFCNTLHPRNNRERSSRLCGKTSKSNHTHVPFGIHRLIKRHLDRFREIIRNSIRPSAPRNQGNTVKKSLRSCSCAALRSSGPTPKISCTVRKVELWL